MGDEWVRSDAARVRPAKLWAPKRATDGFARLIANELPAMACIDFSRRERSPDKIQQGVGKLGNPPGLEPGDRWFKSSLPDHYFVDTHLLRLLRWGR